MDKEFMINDLTYGQRIELGNLFNKQPDETTAILESFKIIYQKEPSLKELSYYIKEDFEEVLEGLKYWIDAEAEFLHYEPTSDEIAAGINQMKCPQPTLIALSKEYGVFPNEVLERPYSEIFLILMYNNETAKFEKRLSKIKSRK